LTSVIRIAAPGQAGRPDTSYSPRGSTPCDVPLPKRVTPMKRVLILVALAVPLGRAAADTKEAEARWAEYLAVHDDAVKTLRSVKDKATATAARDACDRVGRQLVEKDQAAANAFRMLAGS